MEDTNAPTEALSDAALVNGDAPTDEVVPMETASPTPDDASSTQEAASADGEVVKEGGAPTPPLMSREDLPYDPDSDALPFCWCCQCYSCCCQSCVEPEKAAPCDLRVIEFFVTMAMWGFGLYKGGTFNRKLMESLSSGLVVKADPTGKRRGGIASVDMKAPSVFTPGLDIPFRVYRKTNFDGPRKLVFFFHGGGWCLSHYADAQNNIIAERVAASGAVIVSVEYRLAPEDPFPAGLNDCYDAVRWVVQNRPGGEAFKDVDFSSVSFMGDSAGGNFALGVATLVRDKLTADLQPCDLGVQMHRLLLIYPALLMHAIEEGLATNGHFLRRPVMTYFFASYVPGANMEAKQALVDSDRRIQAALAGFHGLPRTLILVGSNDPLKVSVDRAMGIFEKESIDVKLRVFDGYPHGYLSLSSGKATQESYKLLVEELTDKA